jgi:predicted transcriptional regulator
VNTQPEPTLAVSVRVPEELRHRLTALAQRENRSTAYIVRRALERELEREEAAA